MKINLYNLLTAEYSNLRKKAAYDAEFRKTAVYALIPELSEIDDRIRAEGIEYARKMINSDDRAAETLQTIYELKERKSEILKAAGYKSDAFEISYKCRKCSDTGYIGTEKGSRKCSCLKQRMLEILNENISGLFPPESDFLKFDETCFSDSVDYEKYRMKVSPRENITQVRNACMDFVREFTGGTTRNLYFCGNTGTGKTFLAGCVAREILKNGYSVVYQTAPKIFNLINDLKFNGDNEEYSDFCNADLLIIDDLGTESQSGAKYAEFLNILMTRAANNMMKPPCKTIISSNLGMQELYKFYDERIGSRIAGGFDIYRFFGEDLRLKLKRP